MSMAEAAVAPLPCCCTAKFFWFFFFLFLNLTAFTYFGIMAINLTPAVQFGTVFVAFFFTLWNFLCGFLMAQPNIPGQWIWLVRDGLLICLGVREGCSTAASGLENYGLSSSACRPDLAFLLPIRG